MVAKRNVLRSMSIFPESGFYVSKLPSRLSANVMDMLRDLCQTLGTQYFNSTITTDSGIILDSICSAASNLNRLIRTVPSNAVEDKKQELMEDLRQVVPGATNIFKNDVYFRFVSPNNTTTQSIVHRDLWFHSITQEWCFLPESMNVKLWIPLFYSQSEYGIGVVPGSHKSYPYDFEYINNQSIPSFIPHKCTSHALCPVKVPVGYGLVFPPTLLHGGLDIRNHSPRISCEITLLVE